MQVGDLHLGALGTGGEVPPGIWRPLHSDSAAMSASASAFASALSASSSLGTVTKEWEVDVGGLHANDSRHDE